MRVLGKFGHKTHRIFYILYTGIQTTRVPIKNFCNSYMEVFTNV